LSLNWQTKEERITPAEGYDKPKCITFGCNETAGFLNPYCRKHRDESSSMTWLQKLAVMGVALAFGIIAWVIWWLAAAGVGKV